MGPINKALDEIKFRIPKQILDLVFVQRTNVWGNTNWKNNVISIDECIMSTVIRPRVLVDCNLVGGAEVFIPLASVPAERTNDYTTVYRIPKNLTQGRSIISALSVSYSDPNRMANYGTAAYQNNSSMMHLGSAVMNAQGQIPYSTTAQVQHIGENVVMVRDSTIMPANIYLRAIIENDKEMNHIQLKSYRHFSELAVRAVKAYIYNEYRIRLDMGELIAGQNLGAIKEVIESYADAEELYQTYIRETWAKVALMNDRESWTRMYRQLIGGFR